MNFLAFIEQILRGKTCDYDWLLLYKCQTFVIRTSLSDPIKLIQVGSLNFDNKLVTDVAGLLMDNAIRYGNVKRHEEGYKDKVSFKDFVVQGNLLLCHMFSTIPLETF